MRPMARVICRQRMVWPVRCLRPLAVIWLKLRLAVVIAHSHSETSSCVFETVERGIERALLDSSEFSDVCSITCAIVCPCADREQRAQDEHVERS